ncbi:hypothetical protein J5X07_10365 [Actinomyces bowdenii]|uniref:hypothetical protein n=1 Tax=Actinomyces bowdenii TaxID=131109 RepID=UPI001ABCCA87|nr:hypothetical protein [Actinomyces bowdenii]MBO3725419.1 hypothetical protein [Actinomyces bowdenii]
MTQYPGSQPFPQDPFQHVPDPPAAVPYPPPGAAVPPGAPYGPQAPYPYGPGVAAPRRPVPQGNIGPIILLVSGILTIVLAGALLAGSVVSLSRITSSFQPIAMDAPSLISLKASQSYALYTDTIFPPRCEVEAPDGSDVVVSTARTETAKSVIINDLHLNATFEADEAGTYTITCDTSASITGVRQAYVGHAASPSDIGGTVAGIIGGVLLGLVGLFLAVGGGIWWAVRSSARKRQQPLP